MQYKYKSMIKGDNKMLEEMKKMIAEQLGVEEETVTEASSFKEDLGADSLDSI